MADARDRLARRRKPKEPKEWGVLPLRRFNGWPSPMVMFWIGDKREVIGLDASAALAFAEAVHRKARKAFDTKMARKA
jgi:hypothetical protein